MHSRALGARQVLLVLAAYRLPDPVENVRHAYAARIMRLLLALIATDTPNPSPDVLIAELAGDSRTGNIPVLPLLEHPAWNIGRLMLRPRWPGSRHQRRAGPSEPDAPANWLENAAAPPAQEKDLTSAAGERRCPPTRVGSCGSQPTRVTIRGAV